MAYEKKSWKKSSYSGSGYKKSYKKYGEEQNNEGEEQHKYEGGYGKGGYNKKHYGGHGNGDDVVSMLRQQNEMIKEIVEQNKEIAKAILATTQAIAGFFEKLLNLIEQGQTESELKQLLKMNYEVLERIANALEASNEAQPSEGG